MSLRPQSLLLQLCFEGLPGRYLNLGVGAKQCSTWNSFAEGTHNTPVLLDLIRWTDVWWRQYVRKPSPMPRGLSRSKNSILNWTRTQIGSQRCLESIGICDLSRSRDAFNCLCCCILQQLKLSIAILQINSLFAMLELKVRPSLSC